MTQVQGLCAPEKSSVLNSPSIKHHLSQVKVSVVVVSMLAAWLVTHAVMASQQSVPGPVDMQAVADQSPDLLQMPEKSWLSHVNVSRRAQAAIADHVDDLSAEPGSYFRVLTRIYGASTEFTTPEQIAHSADEPMPLNEVERFHQMETHSPVALTRITSKFGRRPNPVGKGHAFHGGIDLGAPTGTPVHAVAAGTVIKATYDRTYGNVVVINHHNGYKTLYAHASKLMVKAGQKVKAGQPIATVGSTGRSTGPHLHFEIHRSGRQVDPGPYLAVL
jgi:murein DD-endopeptidase MepM/ murein hydrolase activator NlpD